MKAFPNKYYNGSDFSKGYDQGMDLRDYFAGQALIGILSCDYSVDEEVEILAYKYADAMMEARK